MNRAELWQQAKTLAPALMTFEEFKQDQSNLPTFIESCSNLFRDLLNANNTFANNEEDTTDTTIYSTEGLINSKNKKPFIQIRQVRDVYVWKHAGKIEHTSSTEPLPVTEHNWELVSVQGESNVTQVAMATSSTTFRDTIYPYFNTVVSSKFGNQVEFTKAGRTTMEVAALVEQDDTKSSSPAPLTSSATSSASMVTTSVTTSGTLFPTINKTSAVKVLDLYSHKFLGIALEDRGPLVVLDMDGTIARKDKLNQNTIDNNLAHSRAILSIKSCLR